MFSCLQMHLAPARVHFTPWERNLGCRQGYLSLKTEVCQFGIFIVEKSVRLDGAVNVILKPTLITYSFGPLMALSTAACFSLSRPQRIEMNVLQLSPGKRTLFLRIFLFVLSSSWWSYRDVSRLHDSRWILSLPRILFSWNCRSRWHSESRKAVYLWHLHFSCSTANEW